MELKKEQVLKMEFRDEEIETFKNIIKKCKEQSLIGFNNNVFDSKEKELIDKLNDDL